MRKKRENSASTSKSRIKLLMNKVKSVLSPILYIIFLLGLCLIALFLQFVCSELFIPFLFIWSKL